MISFCNFNGNSFDPGLMLKKVTRQPNRPCTITASAIICIENGQRHTEALLGYPECVKSYKTGDALFAVALNLDGI